MKDHSTMTQEMTKKSLLIFSFICLLAMVSAVGETASSAPCVVSMLAVPTVIKEAVKDTVEPYRINISSNTLIPVQSHDSTLQKRWTVLEDQGSFQVFGTENVKVGQQAAGVTNQGTNITAQVEVENEQKTQSNLKPNALGDEKTVPGSSSDTASCSPRCPMTPLCLNVKDEKNDGNNIKKSSSNVKDLDSSPIMEEIVVPAPSKRKYEKQTLDSSQTGSHDLVSEIGDEDSEVDILKGELHECAICGQYLPAKDMIQHLKKHIELSPLCSPSRERLRSGKH